MKITFSAFVIIFILATFQIGRASDFSSSVMYGHTRNIMSAPTTTLCGTSATVTGTDMDGKIDVTGVSITTCTLKFAIVWNTIYGCVVSSGDSVSMPYVYSAPTTTSLIISLQSVTNPILYYHCAGK